VPFEVVRVLVSLAVSLLGHQSGGRVAQVKRHRIHPGFGEIVLELTESALQGVRLRREREVHGRLGEGVVGLGHPDEVRGLLGRARDDERLRVRETHVLPREDHDAPRDEHRILTRVDHPHEPIQSGVGVGSADALDERRDRVVVLVARAVIEERAALQGLLDLVEPDGLLSIWSGHGGIRR